MRRFQYARKPPKVKRILFHGNRVKTEYVRRSYLPALLQQQWDQRMANLNADNYAGARGGGLGTKGTSVFNPAKGAEASSSSLLTELKNFNKKALSKTETRIHTEDGKILVESRDASGNYKTVLENQEEYGFVPDMVLDLQVGEIKNYLIFGSQDVAAEETLLDKYNVSHIINLGTYVKNYFPNKFKYKNIKINDTIDAKIVQYFDLAFAFIDEAHQQGGCCFIHCNAGVSRASSFVIGYLMKTDSLTFNEAFSFVKSKRQRACPNSGFMYQLCEYEKQLGLGKNKL